MMEASPACHRSQPQTESGLYNYGLSPHQLREGKGRGKWRRGARGGGGGAHRLRGGMGREVIGVQSLAQIVFYRLSHLALGSQRRVPEGD